jgi:inosine-uridine nucleoside N-ribohydrolase
MEFHPEDYRQWLLTKSPSAIVGLSCVVGNCPLATWLHETHNVRVTVEKSKIIFYAEGAPSAYSTPKWAREYTIAIDAIGYTSSIKEKVTAERALALLDIV